MSVNKVILLGNVGQPPKVTYYDGGNCVAQVLTVPKRWRIQRAIFC